jgi:hypothetical protein
MVAVNTKILDWIVMASQVEEFEQPTHGRPWTAEEDQFLCDNIAFMTDAELAARLGRTEIAVHLRWERDLHLPARSKHPDVVTAHQAAEMLGIDGHKICGWVDMGLIPGRLMPGGRKMRLINRVTFMVWACSPKNWVYFDPKKVKDPHLKRLLKLEAKRWGNEWWTTRQVADYHGVDVNDVNRYIKLGYLKSFRLPVSLAGRYLDRRWSNHFLLKSEATRKDLKFYRLGEIPWNMTKLTPAGLKWLKKALRMGWSYEAIGRSMKVSGHQTVSNWVRRYVEAQ